MGGRPKWRYVWKNGGNYLAMLWLLVSWMAAVLGNWVIGHWYLKPYQHQGGVVIAAGLAAFLADMVCRIRDPYAAGISKFFDPDAGGTIVYFLPVWLIAFAFMAFGIAFGLGAKV